MKKWFIFLFSITTLQLAGQDLSLYERKEFALKGSVLPYRILYPAAVDPSKKYPLLIFLHGAFEKGNDNETQLSIGGRFFLREVNRNNFPAIIIFPQCPQDDSWAYCDTKIDSSNGHLDKLIFPFRKDPTTVSGILKLLIDSLVTTPNTDPKRVYIGGLSQGGMGVLDLVARYPATFAAGFSICGAGEISTAKLFAGKVAIWFFHGESDDVIPVEYSRKFYRQLIKLNADTRFNTYPDIKHNSWVNAFAEKELLPWLFSKEK